MKRFWPLTLGGVLLAAGLGWWVLQVTALAPEDRGNAASYGQFVLAAVGLLISVIALWKTFAPAPVAPNLDELTDQLAIAMRNQWTAAAMDRKLIQPEPLPVRWCLSTEKVAGPVTAATLTRSAHRPFDPLPGLDHITNRHLRTGTRRDLHRVYGGLASGRLLLIGGPGTGKSSAAVLLMLDALKYREQTAQADRQHIPVPVLFTLQNWDPNTSSAEDWLRTKLAEISLFRGQRGAQRATSMLRAGRVAVFLDGLDEIPPELQPGALRALSEQATYRLVVLTRTADLAEVAKQQTLTGAVALELQPLAQADVANYLLHPLTDPAPPAWRTLTSTLTDQPGSAIAEALATPLAVSLVRDTYLPADPVDELCNTDRFAGAGQITNHLLDRAIIAAYTPRPGQLQPRYTPETAHRTLCFIASRLAIRRTRDIVWWDIPTWVPLRLRALISTVTTMAITGLVGLVGGAVLYDEMNNLVVGTIVFLLGFGLSCGLWSGLTLGAPWQIDLAKWRRPGGIRLPIKAVIRMTPGVLLFGLAIGFASWFTLGIFDAFKFGNLVIAIAFGLAVGFLGGIMGATMMAEASNTDIADPVLVWRRDGQFWITGIIVAWVAAGSFASFLAGPRLGFAFGLMFAFAFGSGIGPLMSEAWRTAISQACLTIRYRTPLRLIRFLEDARSRHLLRTVGPIYQFRHATLQDRLAEAPLSRGR